MKTSKFFSPSLYFFFFFFSSITSTTKGQNCSNTFCSNHGPLIKFPFNLLSHHEQQQPCGYPGFDLSCSKKGLTILNLPFSPDYLVRGIDYVNQVIVIHDRYNCMAKRLLSLNLSGSPFQPVYELPFTFFNCSSLTGFDSYQFQPIPCLSGTNFTVIATSDTEVIGLLEPKCKHIKTVPVPMPVYEYGFEFSVESDIQLTWRLPDCGECAMKGGTCRFKHQIGREIGCFDIPRRGLPRSVGYAISIGIGIPGIVCIIGVIFYVCAKLKARAGGGASNGEWNARFSSAVTTHPGIVVVGLDESTIDSYPKMVLSQSRRLPNPDDNCCPICLSEYQAKEELRTIPDCKHSFHSSCIDEWLKMNATCPLCRNCPTSVVHAT